MSSEEPICHCFEVYESVIVDIIRQHRVTTVEQLQRHCEAGTGCGSCVEDLERIIERERNNAKS